jgi:hypothetical protein
MNLVERWTLPAGHPDAPPFPEPGSLSEKVMEAVCAADEFAHLLAAMPEDLRLELLAHLRKQVLQETEDEAKTRRAA